MTQERNEFLEGDGLFYETDTHEWFHDKISTNHARKSSVLWGGEVNDSLNVGCFVIRNKETGEYDRVMMDREKNEIIFDTKSLEDLAFHIDKLKLIKRFKK